MINSLISFSLCSGLLLVIYQLLLKNKTLYTFNRYYLLFSVLFSLAVPFIGIKSSSPVIDMLKPVKATVVTKPVNVFLIFENQQATTSNHEVAPAKQRVSYWQYSLLGLYIVGVLVLLFRFGYNLYAINVAIRNGDHLPYKGGKLILVQNGKSPFTFLNNIFLNKHDYYNQQIDGAILEHELTHARELHSVDIILIELLQVFCWFNPFIPFYRKSIELNHEFIADAAAISNTTDISDYQYLLLNTANVSTGLSITSQFNYLTIKKRLIMMTRSTSAINAIWAKIATVPLFIAAFLLFCSKTDAFTHSVLKKNIKPKTEKISVDTPISRHYSKSFIASDYPYTTTGASDNMIKEYQQIVNKHIDAPDNYVKHPSRITAAERSQLETIFKSMSRTQQEQQIVGFTYPGEPLKAKSPSQADLDLWKNSRTSGIWIDGKKVDNSKLNNYKPSDFGLAIPSRLLKNAVNYKKYRYEIGLFTVGYYEKLYKEQMDNLYTSQMFIKINKVK
ncbi:M56 family metallopeptidase [Mucilaginibacter endophyticus]|uniref:M56 family metallopeptidase n=1 Tax=Mucilaginibacter endophyticus TaxID=2675003 RepID=UPI000E0D1006|nr:M56 family metallopeptidase [Mucilaginibacter endophyticus]